MVFGQHECKGRQCQTLTSIEVISDGSDGDQDEMTSMEEDDDDDVVVDGKQGQHGEQCILQTFRHRETGEPQSPQAEGSVPRYLLQTHYQTRFLANTP